MRPTLANLLYTWDELDVLAALVDERIAAVPMDEPGWGMLNSLRTSLREAQYALRRPA